MAAKKAYGIVPDNAHLLLPELFLSGHDREMVRIFFNTLDTYFQLIGIIDDNTQVLFIKIQLNLLAQT